jgi:hypothetical protein
MNSWIIIFYSFIIGVMGLLFFFNYLMILLRIEFIMVTLYFFLYISNIKMRIFLDFTLVFLSIIIIEGVFGLRLLILFSHSFGNDLFLN